jgi:hypothetical protein
MIFTAIDTAAFFLISWMLDVCIYTSKNKALMSHALGSKV